MKQIKEGKGIMIILFVVFLLNSCTKEADFLNETNPNTITVPEFWKMEDDFEKGLMATYNVLQDVMGGGAVQGMHSLSDLVEPNPWSSDLNELHEYNASEVNDFVTDQWSDLYTGIFRANQVLDHMDDADADLSDSFKVQIEAEARFLRGLYYFWLANNYNNGSVIIHTSVPQSMDEFTKPVSHKDEVYALIFSDLQFAQENLPDTRSSTNLGRGTWGAATAILGKVYLYEGMYEQAREEFEKIIESELYQLTPDISWNFDIEHEHNSESIFEVNFSDVVKPGITPNNATTRASAIAPQEASGSRGIEPAYNLIELYKQDVLDSNDPRNAGQQYSQRALESIAFKGDGQQDFYQRPTQAYDFGVEQEAHIKKFQNWWLPEESVEERSGINERVVRLADVYLMYAETILKTTGNVALAIEYVNKVRERSGSLKLEVSNYNAEELMHHLMYVERPLELAFEGYMTRWNDIRRWGIVEEILLELSQIHYRSLPDELRVATGEEIADPNIVTYRQFLASYENYNPAEDNFFPIPYPEVITNDEVED